VGRRIAALALLAVLGVVGYWLWEKGPFGRNREVIFELSSLTAPVVHADVQLYDASEALLFQQQRSFADGHPVDLRAKLPLARGRYRWVLFLRRGPGLPEETRGGTLSLEDEAQLWLRP
jgi:hypothetical protein